LSHCAASGHRKETLLTKLFDTATEAVCHIYRNASLDLWIQCRTYGPGGGQCQSWCLEDIEASSGIDAFIAQHPHSSVGMNVALRKSPASACMSNDDAEVITAFFIDLDMKPGGLSSKKAGIAFLTAELPIRPSLIVDSGGGLHAYFVLSKPVEIGADMDRDAAAKLVKGFEAWVHQKARELHGWKFDTVSDLARIAALPFSMNRKPEVMARREPIWVADDQLDLEQVKLLIEQVPPSDAAAPTGKASTPRSAEYKMRLAEIESDWIKQKREEGRPNFRGQPVKSNAAGIVAGCEFIRRFFETPAELGHDPWFHGLSVLHHCHRGDDLGHIGSSGHPEYNEGQTRAKLASSNGPTKCETIREAGGCQGCPFWGRITSPIELGERTADEVNNLARNVYLQQTDEIFDVDRNEGVSTDKFRKFHADQRSLSKNADEAFLRDGLSQKVHRRTFDPRRPDEFLVQQNDGTLLLNTYRAPWHDLIASGSADRFFKHLEFLVPIERERRFLTQWLAHLVQKPWEKLRHSVVIVGGQGTGKSALISILSKVLGDGNVKTAKGTSLLSKFNGHLAGGVLLFLEEVSIQGRMEAYEAAKTLITEETDSFERKGKDVEGLPTPRGVILLSNDRYGLHLPENDRRFFVIQSTDHPHPEQDAYYKALFEQSDGDIAAIFKVLKELDLSGFNPHQLPFETVAKKVMIENSRPEVELLVQEMIEDHNGVFAADLITIQDAAEAIRDRTGEKVTERRVRKALEKAGATPLEGQCRIPGGARVRLWAIRNADKYRLLEPSKLGQIYSGISPVKDQMFKVIGGGFSANTH
jgi:hypothetical protein